MGHGSFVYIATDSAVLTPKGVNCCVALVTHVRESSQIIIQCNIWFGDESDDCGWCGSYWRTCHHRYLPSGVSVARPIIAFYSRFRDICIYIYTLIPILSAGGIFFIYTS